MLKSYIKDLRNGDVVLNQQFGLIFCAKKLGRMGNEYYEVILGDKTGQIDAKIWANSFCNCDFPKCKEGDVVEITGKVDSFNEKPQLIIEKMTYVKDYDPADFLYAGTMDKKKLWKYLMDEVNNLDDADIKNLILKIFSDEEFTKAYKNAVAGEMLHHDFIGGLLEHVYEMAKFAKVAKELYSEVKYSELLFGVIFHDIGKLDELVAGGVALKRTKSGFLLGHLVQGLLRVDKYFPSGFDEDKKLRIMHLIASHHGVKEHGSPVVPMTLEAILLNAIDDMSFKVGVMHSFARSKIADDMGFLGYNKYLGANLLSSE